MSNKRLIIALDFKNIDEVSNFISKLDPQKCIAKVGLQLFISEGPKVLEFLSHKAVSYTHLTLPTKRIV